MSLRLGFFGTGDFAVPALQALMDEGYSVSTVVCQPDRPRGRGHHAQAPALKLAAQARGVDVWQPERMREPSSVQTFKSLDLDLACVVAYGQILPQEVLDAPRLGCVNLHASLLPRWRGAAPIEWALASGDAVTGVCVQRMVYRLDAGDVLMEQVRPLGPEDDAPALHAELALTGARLLVRAVQGLEQGTLAGVPQDEARVTVAPLLKKSDGALDFGRSREELGRRFRAFKARPGASTALAGGETLKVLGLEDAGADSGEPGRLLEIAPRGLRIACADGSVWLTRVRPPAGKDMGGADYARGHGVVVGARFTAPREH